MGKATGIFLILAGVGTAALVLPAVDKDAERQLADVVRIATGGAPHVTSQPLPSAATVPGPSTPIVVSINSGATTPQQAQISPSGNQPILISPPQAITRNGTAIPSRPAETTGRADLARDIQKELKRVGCYDGEVTGEWTPNTRRAMKAFVDRVNAALPVDEPDHILRTMVQGHPGFACGKSCPSGQAVAADGRCLPMAIVASKTPNRTEQQPHDVAAITRISPPKAAVPRDVAEAAPAASVITGTLTADAKSANRPSAPKAAWETTIAAAPVAPLPGAEQRMAIGGPALQAAQIGSGVGTRTSQTPASIGTSTTLSSTTTLALPGAIAALTTSGRTGSAGAKLETTGPRQTFVGAQRSAGSGPAPTEADDKKPFVAAPVPLTKLQQERPRTRQVHRAEPPAVFKFPTPNYLGFQTPKFISGGFAKPERSNFGPRVYEGFVRNLR